MPRKYDLSLLEELNREYADKPIAKIQMTDDAGSAMSRAAQERNLREKKIGIITRFVDMTDKVVLELGCGTGQLTAALPEVAGAKRVIGVDVERPPEWSELEGANLEYLCGDLSAEELLPPESVDVVISSVVFEHVVRPLQMLAALHRIMKPGGTAYIRMNLYRARNASHLYRFVFFPWPHLLFEDDVFEDFFVKTRGRSKVPSWVNKMTVSNYVQACSELGFKIRKVLRQSSEIDVEFYRRFEDKLGRYPALDLETDFLTLSLEKPADGGAGDPVPPLAYLERQRHLDARLRGEPERPDRRLPGDGDGFPGLTRGR